MAIAAKRTHSARYTSALRIGILAVGAGGFAGARREKEACPTREALLIINTGRTTARTFSTSFASVGLSAERAEGTGRFTLALNNLITSVARRTVTGARTTALTTGRRAQSTHSVFRSTRACEICAFGTLTGRFARSTCHCGLTRLTTTCHIGAAGARVASKTLAIRIRANTTTCTTQYGSVGAGGGAGFDPENKEKEYHPNVERGHQSTRQSASSLLSKKEHA